MTTQAFGTTEFFQANRRDDVAQQRVAVGIGRDMNFRLATGQHVAVDVVHGLLLRQAFAKFVNGAFAADHANFSEVL
ncbi:hypothetical protein GALL_546860 [mine drainage metagenome]|uniref:Uncharacterized protein n=1 Tax=mine drainage metagenome TaxID=410659 RepID=A0A1J5NYE3_9ZZZZ